MGNEQKSVLDVPMDAMRGFIEQTAKPDEPSWSDGDLKAIFGHQWSTPLAVDLSGLDATLADRVGMLASSHGLVLSSFGDLLRHPNPPLALLELSKEFAKRSLYSPFPSIPHDIARVLYFTSIAAAMSHCQRKITTLDNAEVATGIKWSLACEWLTDDAKAVLESGLEAMQDEKAATS
jgi:hypothetical protein